MPRFLQQFNVMAECRASHLRAWSCPPFLFVLMGLINIAAMAASYALASRFVEEPEVAALIVIIVAGVIFVIGNFIVHGFNQIAEANRTKAEFISIVSHQLRSPLAVFKWTVEAMTRSAAPPAGGGMTHLEILGENADRMIQLVNMLLEVSRIEAGRLLLRQDPVHLDILTEEIIRSYTAYARAGRVSIDYAAPAGLPAVRADGEKAKMIIQNLLDNAIRYSPSGGRIALTIAPFNSGTIEWKIRDSGMGIPPDQQRFIFQKFFRSARAVAAEPQGSGLGLFIARALVQAFGGEIGFESHDGQGSTFWFRLPVFDSRHP